MWRPPEVMVEFEETSGTGERTQSQWKVAGAKRPRVLAERPCAHAPGASRWAHHWLSLSYDVDLDDVIT